MPDRNPAGTRRYGPLVASLRRILRLASANHLSAPRDIARIMYAATTTLFIDQTRAWPFAAL